MWSGHLLVDIVELFSFRTNENDLATIIRQEIYLHSKRIPFVVCSNKSILGATYPGRSHRNIDLIGKLLVPEWSSYPWVFGFQMSRCCT